MQTVVTDIPNKLFCEQIYPYQKDVLDHFDDYPDIKHRVLVWHRRARKTTLAINLLIREAMENKDKVLNYIAPTFRQAKQIAWIDPMMLRRYLTPELLAKPFNETELRCEFNTGCILNIGGAEDPDRWRGTAGYMWVLDEFALMRHGKMLYEEIIYPIIRENNGYVIFLYTPKGRNHGWEYFQKARENKKWKEWFLPITESNIFTADEILEIQDEMPEHRFAQEFMCDFLDSGGGVIKRIREAVSGTVMKPLQSSRYVMGVDLGKKEDYTVLTVMNRDTRHVDAFERFRKIDYSFQKEKIARLSKEYNDPLLMVDSTGVGDSIVDDLKNMGLSVREDGFQFTSKSKKQIIEKLILAIEDRRITYPDIPELIDELEDFDIDERGRYSAPSGLHDDCVISLALAVEGLGAEIYSSGTDEDTYQTWSERWGKE